MINYSDRHFYANFTKQVPDQVLFIAQKTGGQIANSTNPVVIGADKNKNAAFRFFNGKIDYIRIYNRALTATEIQQLYDTEK